jgi:hypothetical protein
MSSIKSAKSFFVLSILVLGWTSVSVAAEYLSGSWTKGGQSFNCRIKCSDTYTVYLNTSPCTEANTPGACNQMVAPPHSFTEKKKSVR